MPDLFTGLPVAPPAPGFMADLTTYDWIVINSSAGKDSQAMLDFIVALADSQGVPRSRLVLLHCDLGLSPNGEPIEWPGTMDLAREHAAFYGLRFIVCKREVRGFLEEIEDRGFWPSQGERYCTSYFKRDQGAKVLTKLANEARTRHNPRPRILNCLGFRAEESPRRKKLPQFIVNDRQSNGRKHVDDWLPIQTWLTGHVWDRIRAAGTKYHYAYDLGMKRLSCVFCIFAPRSALILAGRHNPKLLKEYVGVEQRINHTFRKELPLVEVQRAIQAGEQGSTSDDDGCWNM